MFWHRLLALDGAGRPSPGLTWSDTRSAPAAAALRRAHERARLHARTGRHCTPLLPRQLRWLREARPEVFARAAVWCGFGEYLHARLTGRPATSLSMASGTGLLDQIAGGWDADMLAAAGIAAAKLPPIDDTAAPGLIAPHAVRWPTLARVPWHPARDGRARLGLRRWSRGGRAHVGTSAGLRVVLPGPPGPHAPLLGALRYRVIRARCWLRDVGAAMCCLCSRHRAPRCPRALGGLLGRATGTASPALPFLSGERSPAAA